MTKGRKATLWAALGLSAAAVAVLGWLALTLDGRVRSIIERESSHYLGVPVTVDGVRIDLRSGRFRMTGYNVPNPPGFRTARAIRVGEVAAEVRPSTIFDPVTEVPELSISGLELTVEGSISGSNVARLIASVKEAVARDEAERTRLGRAEAPEKRYRVGRIVIAGARLNLSATFMGGRAATAEIRVVELDGLPAEMTLGQIIQRALEAVVRESANTPGKVGELLAKLSIDAGIGIVGEAVRGAGALGKGAVSGVGEAAKDVGAGAGEVIKGAGTGTGEVARSVGKGVGEIAKGTIGGVGEIVKGVGKGVGEVARGIGQLFRPAENPKPPGNQDQPAPDEPEKKPAEPQKPAE